MPRPCALKLIRPDRAGDPKNLRRFEREVQATATLTHPNTIQIYDYGHAEDGTFYYVMEYLPGVTLEELVKCEGPLAPSRSIHFLRQICGALKEAHSRGLIHRDIKPGNVMVCERGGIHDVAKLLDFGLALPPMCETEGEKLTQDGIVTGTPAYLSPEQAGGQETLDARSDIYSVGALAYFLLAGQPPFANRSGVKLLARTCTRSRSRCPAAGRTCPLTWRPSSFAASPRNRALGSRTPRAWMRPCPRVVRLARGRRRMQGTRGPRCPSPGARPTIRLDHETNPVQPCRTVCWGGEGAEEVARNHLGVE